MVHTILTQVPIEVLDFSSQYGTENGSSYKVENLVGGCEIYPKYGDYTSACVFRTYGTWWKDCPSAVRQLSPFPDNYCSEDFVELIYNHLVWLSQISIFETYNPGTVVRILAANCEPTSGCYNWSVVWQAPSGPINCPATAREFSPPLCLPSFPTRVLRLEFNSQLCHYYTELDAVIMMGIPFDEADGMPNDYKPWSANKKTDGDSDICDDVSVISITDEPSFMDNLPSEVLHRIFSFVDFTTLSRLACVCHRFKDQVQHWFSCELNLRPFSLRVSDSVLPHLVGRCHNNLRRLDLSWCGNHGLLTAKGVLYFLEAACSGLVELRLNNCNMVTDETLDKIVRLCPLLEELDLSSCRQITSKGFSVLTKLERLTRLNLYRSNVDFSSLVSVVRSCVGLQHLNMGSCDRVIDWDHLCLELANNCRGLISLDLWRARSLSAVGLRALADNCPDLAELDLGWCSELHSRTTCYVHLVQKCPKLRKLFLTANRSVCDGDLAAVAQYCPLLEQLDVLGTREITKEQARGVLTACKHLRMLDVSFCSDIDFATVRAWQAEFPACSIKMSFQTTLDSGSQQVKAS